MLFLVLFSVKSVGNLQVLSIEASCLEFRPKDCRVNLKPRKVYFPKMLSTPFRAQIIMLLAFLPEVGSEGEHSSSQPLCPVRALHIYIECLKNSSSVVVDLRRGSQYQSSGFQTGLWTQSYWHMNLREWTALLASRLTILVEWHLHRLGQKGCQFKVFVWRRDGQRQTHSPGFTNWMYPRSQITSFVSVGRPTAARDLVFKEGIPLLSSYDNRHKMDFSQGVYFLF